MRSSSPPGAPFRRRATLIAFASSFAVFVALLWRQPLLFDSDSYFHLAVARAFLERGVFDDLQWARFSAMHEGYGDKELLFHVWLVPWLAAFGAAWGGKLALACQNALLFCSLANLGARTTRAAAVWVPILVFCTSGTFALRLLRLRPETPALLLLLWATWAAAQARYRRLALLAAVFTLAYTAFHALLIMCVLWAAWIALSERRIEWRVVVYPLLGALLALVLHPHFPKNVEIWTLQSIDFFRLKDALPVGTEIQPFTTKSWLVLDAPFVAGALLLWWAHEPRASDAPESTPDAGAARFARPQGPAVAPYFALFALAFFVLTMQMGRFALYLVPFATVASAFALHERGYRLARRIALPAGVRVGTRALVVLAPLAALWVLLNLFVNVRASGALDPASRKALEQVSAALPKGAHVAATWTDAQEYVFWAPQARYLNVLDPVFMAALHPERYRAWRAIADGNEPDVPLTLLAALDSEWLAFRTPNHEALRKRVEADPRMQRVLRGRHSVYRVRRDKTAPFITDFSVRRDRNGKPAGNKLAYPVIEHEALADVEGYVDVTRIDRSSCAWLDHDFELDTAGTQRLEFAPYGPSTLFMDSRPLLHVAGSPQAHWSGRVAVSADLAAGSHQLTIRTCPAQGYAGFYISRGG